MQKGEQARTALSQPQAERDVTWLDTPWTDGWTASRPQQEGMGGWSSAQWLRVSRVCRCSGLCAGLSEKPGAVCSVQNRGVRLGGRDFGPSKGQAGQAGGREPGSSREALPVWKEPGPLTIIHWMIGLSLSGCGLAPQGGRWREDTPSRLPLSPVRSGAPVQPFACPARARGAWVVPSNKPTWAPRQQSASTFCSALANIVHSSNWSLWGSVWEE